MCVHVYILPLLALLPCLVVDTDTWVMLHRPCLYMVLYLLLSLLALLFSNAIGVVIDGCTVIVGVIVIFVTYCYIVYVTFVDVDNEWCGVVVVAVVFDVRYRYQC